MRDYFSSFFPVDFGLYRLMSDEPLEQLVRDFWPLRRASFLLALLAEVEADRPLFESFVRELGGRLNSDGATLSSTLSELIALRRFHWTPGWTATRPVQKTSPHG